MPELFKSKYRIESVRLKDWDYSTGGYYFITICTKDRECFFGNISNGKMELSPIGGIVSEEWKRTEQLRTYVQLDEWIIMPNHLHGIIIIDGDCDCDRGRDVARNVSTDKYGTSIMSNISPKPCSLSTIIRAFKSAVTQHCRKNDFYNFSWQPRFYERIIRNEHELYIKRRYIKNNPMK